MTLEQSGASPEQAQLAQALRLAETQPGERVLDLSGQAGTVALRVAPMAASVEAVQPEEELAEEGRRLARVLDRQNVYFHAGPLHRLPFDGGQFDLVFWCLGLSRERRPLASLNEVARVLSSRGRLVLQDIVAFGRPEIDLKIRELERRRDPAHLVFHQDRELEVLVFEAGLRVRRREHSSLTQDFGYWTDSTSLSRSEAEEMKQVFFALAPGEQDKLDLALADGRISFSYPVVTLLAGPGGP
jgi:SAM-dependent methyltransferase